MPDFSLQTLVLRFLGSNSLIDVAFALLAFLVTLLLLRGFKTVVVARITAYAQRSSSRMDDVLAGLLNQISMFFYLAVSVAAAAQFLVLPAALDRVVRLLLLIAVTVEIVKLLQRFAGFLLRNKLLTIGGRDDENIVQLMQILVNALLWVTAALLVLSNMGVEITSLVASLGIGGIAVALAVQNILGDVFNSFSIYLDRPFEVGDFIIVDPHMGTVKRIGLKTTRIQALSGEELVIPNSELTSARIQNFKQLQRRRIVFKFGVTYDTPPDVLATVGDMIRAIIDDIEDATFDRAHFHAFGDSSLNFEVVYYMEQADYALYMDAQQRINLEIMKQFAAQGIEMAFPTRTVYLQNVKS